MEITSFNMIFTIVMVIFFMGILTGVISLFSYLRLRIGCPLKCFYKKSKRLKDFEVKFFNESVKKNGKN